MDFETVQMRGSSSACRVMKAALRSQNVILLIRRFFLEVIVGYNVHLTQSVNNTEKVENFFFFFFG